MQKFFILFLLSFQFIGQAQNNKSERFTPGGIMDTVFDRFGKKHFVGDLQINLEGRHVGGGAMVSSVTSCTAGMFAVFFANGSGMENTTNPTHAARRQVVCEVLSNISGLLGYNSFYPNSALVNILVDDITPYVAPFSPNFSGVLGLSTGFYAVPWNPASQNPGISENLIQKTIKSRVDAWTNVISPVVPVFGNGFYHGLMAFNFSNSSINWNSAISSTAASTQYDLYSIVLHEMTHVLGFATLIDINGKSKMGAANNYYSLYDKFLFAAGTNGLLSPLLQSNSSCNSQYGLNFIANPGVLSPACTSNYSTDVSNCNTAIRYNSVSSPSVHVYTPDCFEGSASLSHFEDMCYPGNIPSNNNQYFTMSNATPAGLNKRFLKQEEKNVLCDLGYTVNTTYTSNAAAASHTYSGSACTPIQVWGVNDGLVNTGYLYTSSGGPVIIPISGVNGVITNDYQGNSPVTAVSCVESVYNNGSAQVSGNTIVFTPNNTNGGIFVIRYIPKTSSGASGNITYIFGFIYPSFCGASSPCDMVQNGGFENNSGCGSIPSIGSATLASCWLVNTLSPDLFVRGCTGNNIIPANLGTSTYSSSIVFDSHNGAPNNAVMGIGAYSSGRDLALSESLANYLGSPVITNQSYVLSFWAYQFIGSKLDPQYSTTAFQNFNTDSVPVVLTFATDSVFLPVNHTVTTYPSYPLMPVKSVTLSNMFNTWQHYSVTFTTYATSQGNWLYVGMDKYFTYQSILQKMGSTNNHGGLFYTLLDDISLRPASQAPHLNLPTQICTGQSISNLGQYVNTNGGVFTGPGITSSVVNTGSGTNTIYYFNAAQSMTPGIYTVVYSYTGALNCEQTAVQQIHIGNVAESINTTYASSTVCVNGGTLNINAPLPGYSYTWQPGSHLGVTYTVSPNMATTYTVLGSIGSGSCSLIGYVNVSPNIPNAHIYANPPSVCPGNSIQLNAVGNFTSITWQPGNYTTAVINVAPNAATVYTAHLTGYLGCSANVSTLVNIGSIPTLTITASNNVVCSNQSTTLTASGAQYYLWFGTNNTNSVIVVNPVNTSTYYVSASDTSGCSVTDSIVISIFKPSTTISGTGYICAGEKVVLSTPYLANTYVWQPANAYVPTITVTPNTTTNYVLQTTSISASGTCVASNTVTVHVDPCTNIYQNEDSNPSFNLYPNPNKGSFTLLSNQNFALTVLIYGETGQVIKRLLFGPHERKEIELTDVAEGFYMVEANNYHTKLIIIK